MGQLEELENFVRIAEAGGIGRAAASLSTWFAALISNVFLGAGAFASVASWIISCPYFISVLFNC